MASDKDEIIIEYKNNEDYQNTSPQHVRDYLMPPTAENEKHNYSSASELDFMDEDENDGMIHF